MTESLKFAFEMQRRELREARRERNLAAWFYDWPAFDVANRFMRECSFSEAELEWFRRPLTAVTP